MGLLTQLQIAGKKPESLEELLLAIARYGEPSLLRTKSGWWCYVNMHVTSKGASFEIKSEPNHGSPTAAAQQCLERIGATLADFAV